MEERIIIVDENDHILGDMPRSQVQKDQYYRISSLLMFNDSGDVLLGKRASIKAKNPNKWSPIVNGTNAKGESYESNIEKESVEEIGYTLRDYWVIDTLRVEENFNFFVRYFGAIINDTSHFILDPNEISEMRWFKISELQSILEKDEDTFVPKFKKYILPVILKGEEIAKQRN